MRKVRYGPQRFVFRGELTTEFHLGRPNYGEMPELDELERCPILMLDEPIRVLPDPPTGREGDYHSHGHNDVRKLHLVWRSSFELLRKCRGCGIEIEGTLFHGSTGHHRTPVLLDADATPPRVVDARNTFENAVISNTGTGFLIGSEGHIATAAHVIEKAGGVTVTRGLKQAKALIVYVDDEADIAVLHSDLLADVVLPLRVWNGPQLGETVYVLGFPLRPILPHALNMTAGMVSAEVAPTRTRFQVSAPVQKGNSGGPVFDARGNVLGIVASKLLRRRVMPENVNYATYSRHIRKACWDLGITFQESDPWKSEPINSVVLGKTAHQICVEVEAWRSKSRSKKLGFRGNELAWSSVGA